MEIDLPEMLYLRINRLLYGDVTKSRADVPGVGVFDIFTVDDYKPPSKILDSDTRPFRNLVLDRFNESGLRYLSTKRTGYSNYRILMRRVDLEYDTTKTDVYNTLAIALPTPVVDALKSNITLDPDGTNITDLRLTKALDITELFSKGKFYTWTIYEGVPYWPYIKGTTHDYNPLLDPFIWNLSTNIKIGSNQTVTSESTRINTNLKITPINGRIPVSGVTPVFYDGALGTRVIIDINSQVEPKTPTSYVQSVAHTRTQVVNECLRLCDKTKYSPIVYNWVMNYPVDVYSKNSLNNVYTYINTISKTDIITTLVTICNPLYTRAVLNKRTPPFSEAQLNTIAIGILLNDITMRNVYHCMFQIICELYERYLRHQDTECIKSVYQLLWRLRYNDNAPLEYSYGNVKYNNLLITSSVGISLAKNLVTKTNTSLDARLFAHTFDKKKITFTYINLPPEYAR